MTLLSSATRIVAGILLMFGGSRALRAQPEANAEPVVDTRLRVFLDCQNAPCDRNFFITDLPFALFTQDRLDSDVHLLITRIGTASGGGEYTLTFNGQKTFVSRVDTMVTFMPPNSSDDMRRRELARVAKVGLAPFAMRRPGSERFTVRYDGPSNGTSAPRMNTLKDPWNFWVYRLRLNGSGSAESRSSNYEVTTNVNASRTTEDWKLSLNGNHQYRANAFELSGGEERRFALRAADVSARVVRSLTNHWSIGSQLAGGYAEFRNTQSQATFDVSAEYNFYPWAEATSKQLLAVFALGHRYFDYYETSIFGLTTESRQVASMILATESRQRWGNVDGSVRYTNYLHNSRRYNLSVNARTNIRLTRGLSLELRGDASKVNDQLFLARGEATDDQILTRQRALATAYRVSGSVGINFTFGSIYNTIVNPRLNELYNPGG
jgi:hypothetical protein